MKPYTTTHPNTEVKFSYTYTPSFERDRLKAMKPKDRHQHMLEEHRQAKATRRENHNKGVHRMPRVLSILI